MIVVALDVICCKHSCIDTNFAQTLVVLLQKMHSKNRGEHTLSLSTRLIICMQRADSSVYVGSVPVQDHTTVYSDQCRTALCEASWLPRRSPSNLDTHQGHMPCCCEACSKSVCR